ncbi:uncharacterized protein Dere_GG15277 [Drosophila erecta]|uniref:G-protein coupled receptors family 2 profile 2 domain-containing protein n=2 Tax=Drosophila erecta TaxID=7220 RepID=B3NC74_DROER|nr:uncharacterized protein Dere_GG15277 [Drosophila erecta]
MILVGSFITYLLLKLQPSNAEIADCNFLDTVNITEAERFSDGSYLYEGVLIPAHLTAKYEFKLLGNGEKEQVPSHMRGCVCKVRPCVRFCCPHDHIMNGNNQCESNMTSRERKLLDPILNVTLADGSVVQRHFKKDFIVQWDLPKACDNMFYVDNREKEFQYTLFENGTFLRHLDQAYLNKREYCLQHITLNNNGVYNIRIVPQNCPVEVFRMGQTVVMTISLICFVLTIAVYLCVKKLMNLEGKCFTCYVVCLFFGFLFLLLNLWQLTRSFCQIAGFLGYYFVMAAFFWLSVISRHLWKFLTSMNDRSDRAFLRYSCFAWGMPLVLTGVTFLAGEFVESDDWKPCMGGNGHCWIFTENWSAMLYFYGPMVILIGFNFIMFILTAKHLSESKRAIRNFALQEGRELGMKSEKQNYVLFLLLFTIMGISWSFEIFNYFVQREKLLEMVVLVFDYFNWSQGIIIFVLFILRRKTLTLFKEQ